MIYNIFTQGKIIPRLSLQPWASRCARGAPYPIAGCMSLSIVKIDPSEVSLYDFAGWLLIGQFNNCINLLAWKQEALLINKRGGQCTVENSCLFGLEEFVLDNFKEKESLDFKQPILVWGKFLILPIKWVQSLSFQSFCLVMDYSLTSPYGHLSFMDSLFGPRNAKSHTFATSIIRTPL